MLARNAVKAAWTGAPAQVGRATTSSSITSFLRVAATAKSQLQHPHPQAVVLPPWQCRSYATPPPQVVHSDLPTEKYHAYSDATMDRMLRSIEDLLDNLGNPDYEVEYSSGVLTLKLGEKGTYVINKQPPNKQIWLSSPFSGPKRYDYSELADNWVYSRDDRTMGDLIDAELTNVLGQEVNLGISSVSQLES